MNKADIRKKILAIRRNEKNRVEKSLKICSFLKDSELFKNAKKILFFASLSEEVDLLYLIKNCKKT